MDVPTTVKQLVNQRIPLGHWFDGRCDGILVEDFDASTQDVPNDFLVVG